MFRFAAPALLVLVVGVPASAQQKLPDRYGDRPLVTHIYTADAAAHVFQ